MKKVVTKSDFEKYKAEVLRQIERLGLKDWCVEFEFADLSKDHNEANVTMNYKNRKAMFGYSTKLNGDGPHIWIGPILAARHEVAHLLIHEIEYLGECRFLTDSEMPAAVEKLVTILQKVL